MFDIPKFIECIEAAGVDPIEIFSDPKLPEHLRYFNWRPGRTKEVTASGKVKPINPAQQWHNCDTTSSFTILDAMCVYRRLRLAQQEDPKTSLDYILKKELKSQKLKFPPADKYQGLDWHIHMRENYPLEYMCYALYDVRGMLELDAKTKDLAISFPVDLGTTDFSQGASQTRKLLNALHFFCLEEGYVIGTTPTYNEEKAKSQVNTLSLDGWIVILPSHLMRNEGEHVLEDAPSVGTSIRLLVADLDCVSSYPSNGLALNISKTTCKTEIVDIKGLREGVFRLQNINLTQGHVNAIEYCTTMFGMMTMKELDDYYERV